MNYKICLPMKLFMLFCFGGCAYTITELLFRGNSHWTMFILGGICFLLVGGINEKFDLSLPVQMAVSSLIITALEFLCGCIVNLWPIGRYGTTNSCLSTFSVRYACFSRCCGFSSPPSAFSQMTFSAGKCSARKNPSTALPENAPSKPLTAYGNKSESLYCHPHNHCKRTTYPRPAPHSWLPCQRELACDKVTSYHKLSCSAIQLYLIFSQPYLSQD